MDSLIFWEIGAILVLILANGFFSLAEFSIIASRKSKLKQKLQERKKGAETRESRAAVKNQAFCAESDRVW